MYVCMFVFVAKVRLGHAVQRDVHDCMHGRGVTAGEYVRAAK